MYTSNLCRFCFRKMVFFVVTLFCLTTWQPAFAGAVPLEKNISQCKAKTNFKKKKEKAQQFKFQQKSKKHPEKILEKRPISGWWWVALWYLLFTAMLILGVVFGIVGVWVTAIVFLGLPVLAALVFLIIFLVALGTGGFSLC